MKIIRMKIDWRQGLGNLPRILVLVDQIPKQEELFYQRSKTTPNLHLAVKEGYADFFSWSHKGDDGGYYHAVWERNIEGTVTKVLGPWSARAGVINWAFEQQILSVGITVNEKDFEENQFFMGAITVELALEGLDRCCEAPHLVKVEEEDEHERVYLPFKCNPYTTKVTLMEVEKNEQRTSV
jgi:hypothetical protein